MAYSFEQIFAADPSNPANIAQNAAITIYAPGDATETPIALTDPSGSPLTNPVPVNANGFGPAFMADIDRVAWTGGGFSGFFTSYEGMKQVAVDAQAAAETAATAAGAAAETVGEAATNYITLVQAAKNPDLLISGAITLDGSDQVLSAGVAWPDGSPGTFTITERHATGAVNAYTITYGSPATKTFTQPTITRNTNGAATNVPQIVVS